MIQLITFSSNTFGHEADSAADTLCQSLPDFLSGLKDPIVCRLLYGNQTRHWPSTVLKPQSTLFKADAGNIALFVYLDLELKSPDPGLVARACSTLLGGFAQSVTSLDECCLERGGW